jgi:hypothetical protein
MTATDATGPDHAAPDADELAAAAEALHRAAPDETPWRTLSDARAAGRAAAAGVGGRRTL